MKRRIQWSVTGQRNRGQWGREVFCAVGFGSSADEAIADALKSDPDAGSWRPEELIAKPDRIHLQGESDSIQPHKLDSAGSTPAPAPILPAVSSLVASVVLLASVCVASGGQSVSVASRIDEKRPHRSEPWLSPDSLGAQSERAVSHGRFSSPDPTSPTENNSPSPGVFHDRVGLSADLPSVGSTRGVGKFFDRDLLTGLLTTGAAIVVLGGAGCWITRYPDRRDEEEQARRVRALNSILEGPL